MGTKVATGMDEPDDAFDIIRTSDQKWFENLAKAYKDRQPIRLIDDANVGINPAQQSLLSMGKQTGLTRQEWTGVLIALGMSIIGVGLVIAAIIDPDPTSKLGLLIAAGGVCILGGGFTAIRILTKLRPPSVTVSKKGFVIKWD